MEIMNRAFQIHETRVSLLESLAKLAGCPVRLGTSLADGSKPDVFRVNLDEPLLFVGEAKNTESPACLATRTRMQTYFEWLSAFQRHKRGNGIFAICFGDKKQSPGWVCTVNYLASKERLSWKHVGQEDFGPGFAVVWFVA